MNRSQKTILILTTALLAVSIALPASAGLLDLPQFNDPCDVCEFARLLSQIKNLVLEIAAPAAVLFIIIGGVMMSASAGIPAQVQRAKSIITSAIIGLVILLCAWLIVSAVMAATLGPGVTSNWWTVTCPEDTTCKYQTPSQGPTPGPEGCGKDLADRASRAIGTCYGPCHCANFVTRMLQATGCTFGSNSPDGLASALLSNGWQQVSSPQAGDVAIQAGHHAGIMVSSTIAVHARNISEDGDRPSECAGKCYASSHDCPQCQEVPGPYHSDRCFTNQCVAPSNYPYWTNYYRPPAGENTTP